MEMKRKQIRNISLLIGLTAVAGAYFLGVMPIVIGSTADVCNLKYFKKEVVLNPLSDLNDSDKFEIYLWMSYDDMYSNNILLNGKVLKCDDQEVLKSMKPHLKLKSTDADLATTNSRIYIYRNTKLVFSSSIHLEKNHFGFQSSDFGWIEKNELLPYLKKFKKVYAPVVFL